MDRPDKFLIHTVVGPSTMRTPEKGRRVGVGGGRWRRVDPSVQQEKSLFTSTETGGPRKELYFKEVKTLESGS